MLLFTLIDAFDRAIYCSTLCPYDCIPIILDWPRFEMRQQQNRHCARKTSARLANVSPTPTDSAETVARCTIYICYSILDILAQAILRMRGIEAHNVDE